MVAAGRRHEAVIVPQEIVLAGHLPGQFLEGRQGGRVAHGGEFVHRSDEPLEHATFITPGQGQRLLDEPFLETKTRHDLPAHAPSFPGAAPPASISSTSKLFPPRSRMWYVSHSAFVPVEGATRTSSARWIWASTISAPRSTHNAFQRVSFPKCRRVRPSVLRVGQHPSSCPFHRS